MQPCFGAKTAKYSVAIQKNCGKFKYTWQKYSNSCIFNLQCTLEAASMYHCILTLQHNQHFLPYHYFTVHSIICQHMSLYPNFPTQQRAPALIPIFLLYITQYKMPEHISVSQLYNTTKDTSIQYCLHFLQYLLQDAITYRGHYTSPLYTNWRATTHCIVHCIYVTMHTTRCQLLSLYLNFTTQPAIFAVALLYSTQFNMSAHVTVS